MISGIQVFGRLLLRHWLLAGALVGLVGTMLALRRLPRLDAGDLEVLWLLGVLSVSVKGLEVSGLTRNLALRMEQGRKVPLKLTLFTFFLAMLVTNDVALLAVVPMTLLMGTRLKGLLVILEALAANAGSALTPFGNPQNLYIYWHFDIQPLIFMREMSPLVLFYLILLAAGALLVRMDSLPASPAAAVPVGRGAWMHLALLLLVIAVVLNLLPLWVTPLVPLWALAFDRRSLAIDFELLVIFACFFALSDNLRQMLGAHLMYPGHLFLLAAGLSQLVSNVPAALLLAPHTEDWRALTWGVSVGGFGSLVGSLANLIAWRLYVRGRAGDEVFRFTFVFILLGGLAFLAGVGLYYLV